MTSWGTIALVLGHLFLLGFVVLCLIGGFNALIGNNQNLEYWFGFGAGSLVLSVIFYWLSNPWNVGHIAVEEAGVPNTFERARRRMKF